MEQLHRQQWDHWEEFLFPPPKSKTKTTAKAVEATASTAGWKKAEKQQQRNKRSKIKEAKLHGQKSSRKRQEPNDYIQIKLL